MSLQLVPDKNLVFKGPFNVTSKTELSLFNNGDDRLAFRIKATAPTCYLVKSRIGFVDPHTNRSVQIDLRPLDAANQQNDRAKHRFMIQWAVVPNTYKDDVELFWKEDLSTHKIQDFKLGCVFADEQPDPKITQLVMKRQSRKSTIELGYLDSERVVGNAPGSELICSICHNILWKPVACTVCENTFCAGCIRTWINKADSHSGTTCPFHCAFKEKRAPPVINVLLSKLQISCAYRDNGCQEKLGYDALETHEKTCEYERAPCHLCQMLVSRRDLINNKHEIRQCFAYIQQMKIDNQVQAQLMTLLDIIDEQNKRIKALENQLNKTKESNSDGVDSCFFETEPSAL